MKVKVKFDIVLDSCKEYIEFSIQGKRIILMRSDITFTENNSIILDHKLAKAKGIFWKLLYKIPPYIAPKYNQTAIDELKIYKS